MEGERGWGGGWGGEAAMRMWSLGNRSLRQGPRWYFSRRYVFSLSK